MSMLRRIFRIPFLKLACVYFLIVAILYTIQGSLIFPAPDFKVDNLPEFAEFTEMKTADGETLRHVRLRGEEGAPKLMFFHGNGTLAALQMERGRKLQENGFDVLLIEYRGYGGSTGTPTADALLKDSLAVYDWYKEDEADWVFLYGHSLGTGVASYLSSKRPVQSMVLEAPYTSLADVAADKYFLFPARMLIRHHINTVEYLKDTKTPILIIHGTEDVVIPLKFGEELYQNLDPNHSTLKIIDQAGHNNLITHGSLDMALGHFSKIF